MCASAVLLIISLIKLYCFELVIENGLDCSNVLLPLLNSDSYGGDSVVTVHVT